MEYGGKMKRVFLVVLIYGFFGIVFAQDYQQAVSNIADKMGKAIGEKGQSKIVITNFANLTKQPTELGYFLSERLSTEMVSKVNIKVIDRQHFDSILKELKISEEVLQSENKFKSLKVYDVDVVLVGTVASLHDGYSLNVKAISVYDDSVVVAAANENFENASGISALDNATNLDNKKKSINTKNINAKPVLKDQKTEQSSESVHNWFQAGLEAGYYYYDSGSWNTSSNATLMVQQMKADGWSSASETHSENISGIYWGPYAQVNIQPVIFGLGYRMYNKGNVSITAKDSQSFGYYWINKKYNESAEFQLPYLYLGLFKKIHNIDYSLRFEYGLTHTVLKGSYETTAFTNVPAPDTYESNYRNYTAENNSQWYAIRLDADLYTSPMWVFGLNFGYKFCRFNEFKITKMNTSYPDAQKQGDILVGLNGERVQFNIDGVTFGLKLAIFF